MSPLPPIFAFGIAGLPMLGWLGAAAAPILIHLLSRRKYRETTWAAMEYLLAAMKRQTRKLLLEQWLLLLLRTLTIVLIVTAAAEPYMESLGLAVAAGGRTHRVLVLDASYSMAYKPTDKTRFQRAKELAAQIVDESAQGDAFTLVLMAARPQVVVGTPGFEPSQIREEIDGLELTHAGADLPATIAAVQKVIDNAKRESARLERHEVYFLTDLQRATWAPGLGETAMAEFHRQSEELARSATLVVIDLGQAAAENIAVTSLRAAESTVTVGRKVELQAEVRNFGRQGRGRQPVDLLVDGRRIEQKHIDVPAGGATATLVPVKFEYRFETPGDHAVEVRAEGDALEVDNHRYLIEQVRQSFRVLCINGRPSGERFQGATDYLAAALAPRTGRDEHPTVEVDVATESALLERDLNGYDCVFLANVGQLTASEARVMDAYLGRGGNLAFFLGDQVRAERYNRELGGGAAGPRILPARLGAIVEKRQTGLDPLGYRHPMVWAFRGRDKAGLLTTPVSKYFKLELAKDSKARVAVALGDGDPLVVEESIRRGRVVLVATSADTSWTPMPVWSSFVPLVQEILAWCVAGQGRQRNLEVGESLAASVAAQAAEASISVKRPDGQTRSGQIHPEGDYSEWSYDDTLLGGIYAVRFGPPVSRTQSFAVNVNTAESDLALLGTEELQNEVWPGIPFVHQTSWQNLDAGDAGRIARPGRLHVDLLYAVLGLLFVETVLAWRFGHHRV
jgi:hypothetical protein